jgi:hypothetical protein
VGGEKNKTLSNGDGKRWRGMSLLFAHGEKKVAFSCPSKKKREKKRGRNRPMFDYQKVATTKLNAYMYIY